MKMLTIENIVKTYGDKQLFHEIGFTIAEKERIGLIGVNGTGKSSLLKIVAGIDQADSGNVIHPKDYQIAYLSQDPELDADRLVLDEVFHGNAPILKLMRDYEHALSKLNRNPDDQTCQNALIQIQREMDAKNGWDVNSNAKSILMKLGIHQFDKKIGELSGGQKKRVALATVLVAEPDLLILDEPTNHLDHESVKWLEDYLSKYTGALLLVTHDRYFLDRVTNRIFELDGGSLYSYKGNYAAFLEAKAAREESEASTADKKRNMYRRELEWIRRGAKARTTKQKARIERFEKLEKEVDSVKSKGNLDMFLSGSRLGKQVFEFKSAAKCFQDQRILQDFNFLVKPGDRIGIIGRNGTGKSTILNIIAGLLPLDSGELHLGQTVRIAYYRQENQDLDENKRMIEYITETAEVVRTADGKTISASQMLERFLFPPSSHGTPIRKLSGGEKRRLYLLKLLMDHPNVLLLDEPTNDLDTQTLTVLEDYLEDFPGVVITVSHDRYFLDKVVDQLLILHGDGKMESYIGNYSEYLEKPAILQNDGQKKIPEHTSVKAEPKKKRMSYLEKREWEEIEPMIAELELKLEELAKQVEETGSDYERAHELMQEQTNLNEKLELLIERWSYLSEMAE